MQWFFDNGMYSVFPNQNNEEILSQNVPEPEGDVANLGYVSDALIQARAVSILIFFLTCYFILLYYTNNILKISFSCRDSAC